MNERQELQFDDDCYCEDGCTVMGEHAVCNTANEPACLGGAPHWWGINAYTDLPECRLCHKSPNTKESL